jgi:hypothetical protein
MTCFEFCSQNAMHLEEKEKREKDMRKQIIEEGEEYIRGFYEKRKLNIETNIATNREREKVIVSKSFGSDRFLCIYHFPYFDDEYLYWNSCTWPIKRNSTKRQTNSTGKQ